MIEVVQGCESVSVRASAYLRTRDRRKDGVPHPLRRNNRLIGPEATRCFCSAPHTPLSRFTPFVRCPALPRTCGTQCHDASCTSPHPNPGRPVPLASRRGRAIKTTVCRPSSTTRYLWQAYEAVASPCTLMPPPTRYMIAADKINGDRLCDAADAQLAGPLLLKARTAYCAARAAPPYALALGT